MSGKLFPLVFSAATSRRHNLSSPHCPAVLLTSALSFLLLQVNIIPIIAKADTISKSELHKFKIKIMSELVSNGVQIYQFPTDDEAVAEINSVMNVSNAANCRPSRSCDTLNCCAKTRLKGKFPWDCPDAKSVSKSSCGSDRCLRLSHTELIKMWLLFNICRLSGDTHLGSRIGFIGFLKNTSFKIHFICF